MVLIPADAQPDLDDELGSNGARHPGAERPRHQKELPSTVSTATISTTRPATADVQWPSRPESTFRILESWSGHLCGSFAQQQDADPHCHTGYGDWKCVHSEVVWHWELDAAADRARTTLNKWGL